MVINFEEAQAITFSLYQDAIYPQIEMASRLSRMACADFTIQYNFVTQHFRIVKDRSRIRNQQLIIQHFLGITVTPDLRATDSAEFAWFLLKYRAGVTDKVVDVEDINFEVARSLIMLDTA